MTNREKALELANDIAERIEASGIETDTQDLMSYALVLVLSEISETLSYISDNLDLIIAHGIGVEN